MNRITIFLATVVVLAVFIFGGTAALAVSRSEHRDSPYTNGLGGSAYLRVTKCCEDENPYSSVKVRLTARPVTGSSTDTYYTYGTLSGGKSSLSHTSSKSVLSSNVVLGTAHACYAKCGVCQSGFGAKDSKYHRFT